MKKHLPAAAIFHALASIAPAAVIDFGDLSVPASGYEDGANLNGSFTSRGAVFNNFFDNSFGPYFEGFAYSRKGDTTTPGFLNQYSALTGGGSDLAGNAVPGDVFAVAFTGGFTLTPEITLAATESSPLSLRVTNTTYAGLSLRDGDGFAKKFGGATGNDPDFFKLTITALDSGNATLGAIEVFLADFRFSDNTQDYILDTWRNVDLTPLGSGVRKLQFALASSDNSRFGMNTPAYFAADNLIAVPEPSGVFFGLSSLAAIAFRRRRVR